MDVAQTHIQTSQNELDRIRSSHQRKTGKGWSHTLGRVWFWVLIVFIMLYTLFPFYWAVISSLKTSQKLVNTPPTFWPQSITWANYKLVFEDASFMRALLNSAIVSTAVVILSLLLGTVAAYAMARLHFRGRT